LYVWPPQLEQPMNLVKSYLCTQEEDVPVQEPPAGEQAVVGHPVGPAAATPQSKAGNAAGPVTAGNAPQPEVCHMISKSFEHRRDSTAGL
jgi:hypothetical protein